MIVLFPSTFLLVYALEATFCPIILKLDQNVFLMKSGMRLRMCHVWSKTRPLGQIFEKPCVRSRGHIFSPITMKLGQSVGLDEISDKFENGSC